LTHVVEVLELNEPSVGIADAYVEVCVVEDLPELVAYRVVDALHVAFGSHSPLHGVDERQLGRSLLYLSSQLPVLRERVLGFQCVFASRRRTLALFNYRLLGS